MPAVQASEIKEMVRAQCSHNTPVSVSMSTIELEMRPSRTGEHSKYEGNHESETKLRRDDGGTI